MPLKMSHGTEAKPPPYSREISRVGNLIIVKWSLKYVVSKSILCFISINTKIPLTYAKNKIQNFKLHLGKFWGIFFIVKKESNGLINLLVT